MNKKFLGIRVGTILMAFISLLVSMLIWFYVEYENVSSEDASVTASVACQEVYNAL